MDLAGIEPASETIPFDFIQPYFLALFLSRVRQNSLRVLPPPPSDLRTVLRFICQHYPLQLVVYSMHSVRTLGFG